ncbi:MAG TPA: hypothetical protein VNX29_01975 [Kaistia sp.]|nr:hypothetical protein [Kaistia sp.]
MDVNDIILAAAIGALGVSQILQGLTLHRMLKRFDRPQSAGIELAPWSAAWPSASTGNLPPATPFLTAEEAARLSDVIDPDSPRGGGVERWKP